MIVIFVLQPNTFFTLKNLLLSLAVLFLTFSCSPDDKIAGSIVDYIPDEASYILKVPDINNFLTLVDSTTLFSENSFLINNDYKDQLKIISPAISETSILTFSENGNKSFDYLLISRGTIDSLATDTIQKRSVETFTYDSFEIKKFSLENNSFFTSTNNDILLASNSREHLVTVFEIDQVQQENQDIFKKIYAAADADKISLFINHQKLDEDLDRDFQNAHLPLSSLTEWSGMDFDQENQNISLNGITTWSDNSGKLLQIFSNVSPLPNKLAHITPANSAGFYSFTYDDFPEFTAGLQVISGSERIVPGDHFLNYTREAGIIFTAEENVLALTATDITLAGEAIQFEGDQLKEHRNIIIYSLSEDPGLDEILTPLVKEHTSRYYARLDEYLLFAQTPAALENIISSYLNKSTLGDQEYYADAMKDLASSSSLLMVANTAEFKNRAEEAVTEDILPEFQKLDLTGYPIIALQFVGENNFAHLHGIFSTTRSAITNGVSQLATIEVENSIATPAFLLANHTNGGTEVAFQDENNLLFLFSSSGQLLWQKELDGRINGEITQVDLFKNGNLQMAFSTPHAFYILDRNGNSVKPFPVIFRDEVTQPLAVFDYDNNRNYRFAVTQNRDILMYDSKGRIVKGFDFKRSASSIAQAPKHIRTNTKDYILAQEENGNLQILSRQGKTRVPVKEKFDITENRWYLNEGYFTGVNSSGELIRIDERGNISRENTEMPSPFYTATENTKVLQSENFLKINNNTVTLDFGLYSNPEIFSLRNKEYISITDTQAQKVFLFNENAELLPGFPVYGTSPARLYADNEGKITLSVKAEDNLVILYRL